MVRELAIADNMVAVEDVALTYGDGDESVEALAGASFALGRGSSCAIIGPSGCGKSTLLYVLAGLLVPTSGRVSIGGEPVRPKRPGTALILQDYGLFPWKTVRENAALGLDIRGIPRKESGVLVEGALRQVGLWEFRDRYPAQLSGGQRQRVAIARSLALSPDLLLMDEPFSSLDALTREGLQDLLLKTWVEDGLTTVLVTHSIEEAVFLGRRILVFSPRPGRVIASIENPGAGDPAYRSRPEFYRTCTLVREELDKGMKGR